MPYTDIGANLCSPKFARDLPEVVARAQQAGVSRMLVTASDLEESAQVLQLCQQYPDLLFATAGVHPHRASQVDADFIQQLETCLEAPCIRACGEMGLDYNKNYSAPADQEAVFAAQLELAANKALPVFLHERDANKRFLGIFRPWRDALVGGVLHCFTGTADSLCAYLDLDLYIGITGWICDIERGHLLRQIVRNIPDDRLLIETDAPYLTPQTIEHPPNRNEPALLPEVARVIAKCRAQSVEHVANISHRNAAQLFRLDDTEPAHAPTPDSLKTEKTAP